MARFRAKSQYIDAYRFEPEDLIDACTLAARYGLSIVFPTMPDNEPYLGLPSGWRVFPGDYLIVDEERGEIDCLECEQLFERYEFVGASLEEEE